MDMRLMGEKYKGPTQIKCTLKEHEEASGLIDAFIAVYGGKEEKRNSRYVYFTVNADLMNRNKRCNDYGNV